MTVVDELDPADGAAETIYKWTIRALYTTAIALNLWYLVETYRDTPEGQRVIAQLNRVKFKVTKPWRERKHWRRDVTAMMVDAETTVERAAQGTN